MANDEQRGIPFKNPNEGSPAGTEPTESNTYFHDSDSLLWNVKVLDVFSKDTDAEVPKCPPDWDEEELGKDRPMYYYGVYIKHCKSGDCVDPQDYDYTLLPGSEADGECAHISKWWDDVLSGFCTPEAAERYYHGAKTSIQHGGGNMSIEVCGNLEGYIWYGIDADIGDDEVILVGDEIENCLNPGLDYTLQVFADDEESCGTLGTGGNLATDPERPGWFFVEVQDPYELKCPGFAGHPDLDGIDYEYPNFALSKYSFDGTVLKYEYEKDGNGPLEYHLPFDTYTVFWTETPPERPKGAEWPPRHTDKGAWIGEVSVNYYTNPEENEFEALPWTLELVYHREDGLWMLLLYNPEGKPSAKRKSRWFDVFVNPTPIGPCRLGMDLDQAETIFWPLRTTDVNFLDGDFAILPPEVPYPTEE